MTRFTITIDADLDDHRNRYVDSDAANIGEALQRGHIQPGVSVSVELSTGDVVHGSLVAMTSSKPTTMRATGRSIRKSDIESLRGLWVEVTIHRDLELAGHAQGIVGQVGYGAFGGLFIEFTQGDDQIGWNPEDQVTLKIHSGAKDD